MDPMNTIRFVTITGADESVEPSSLIHLSRKYPFVEWAILFSQKHRGVSKFPGIEWLNKLLEECEKEKFYPNLSLHLCGHFVRQFLMGNDVYSRELGGALWLLFNRVQLNTHAEDHEWHVPALVDLIRRYNSKEYIFQIDGNTKNLQMAQAVVSYNTNTVSFLIDGSHGAGILPGYWPMPMMPHVSHGYAGGLGPDNLVIQANTIRDSIAAKSDFAADWWIDMETKVRSDQDTKFDLVKVQQVLEIAAPWFDGQE